MWKVLRVLLDPQEGDNNGGGSPDPSATDAGDGAADSQAANSQRGAAKVPLADTMRALAHKIAKQSASQSTDDDNEGSDVSDPDNTDNAEGSDGQAGEGQNEGNEGDNAEGSDDEDGDKSDDQAEGDKTSANEGKEKGPVKYERFEKINNENKDLKLQLAQIQPMVEAQQSLNQILNEAGATLEEFQGFVDILALSKTDPAAALAKLKPIYQGLAEFDEEALPVAVQQKINGLAQRVKDGEFEQAVADELKASWIAQVKAERRNAAGKKATESQQARSQQAIVKSYTDALASWTMQKQRTVPDFAPNKRLRVAYDAFLMGAMAQAKLESPSDLVKLLETTFAKAKAFLHPEVKKNGKSKPQPSSQGAVTRNLAKPKTLQEVAAAVASQHGIAYVPRK